jgi:hypothetical protein
MFLRIFSKANHYLCYISFNINKIKFDNPQFISSEGYGFRRGVGLVTLTVFDITGAKFKPSYTNHYNPVPMK